MPADARGDDVYQPQGDGGDLSNDEFDLENPVDEREPVDGVEARYRAPGHPVAVDTFGTTGAEVRQGESLEQRLALEDDDVEPSDGDGDLLEGAEREPWAGRLGAVDEAARWEKDVLGEDAGVDGGAAEEAAVLVADEADVQRGEG
ncbi:DUF5709 domain-containing protein [Streptomyces sp. NPDC006296]|uniref:DUF5709 domain-containing protein n=1 Tax=Streptomyces sp. NPDC006296 TaxID=3156746 RepID=UPI0033BBB947